MSREIHALRPQVQNDICLIGELAETVGLEPKTVRYYERAGLLKPQRVGHCRIYNKSDVESLKTIRFLRQLDLSVKSIKLLFEKYGELSITDLPEEAKDLVNSELQKRRDEIAQLENVCRQALSSFAI